MTGIARRMTWWLGAALLICLAAVVLARLAGRPAGHRPPTLLMEPTPQAGRVTQERIKAKERVIRQLLAEELTLVEAAAWFGYLNDTPPDAPLEYRSYWPGASDGEKLCRQVIHWVRKHGEPEGEQRAERLERELEQRLAANTSLELPW